MSYGEVARVLVVDDEPTICMALELALRRLGYEVVSALCGESALERLRVERFDVLVLDFRMPDLRGDVLFELAAAMQPRLRERTVFMTGDITERAQLLIEACRCPMLHKPFELHDLTAAVEALARRIWNVSA